MSHTKEPWFVSSGREGQAVAEIVVGNGSPLRIRANAEEEGIATEDARRIVACVNACAGSPTEWLEQNAPVVLLGPPIADRFREIEKQRDELLAACEKTVAENLDLADGDVCTLIDIKRAIASVKGGAA